MTLYRCSPTTKNLNQARLERYYHKVATSSAYVEPQALPPTSNSTRYQSWRVYLQVQEWLGHQLDPTAWGWKCSGGRYKPIMGSQAPAPDFLMDSISCICKTGCVRTNCTCRKLNLPCTLACGTCHGDCSNTKRSTDFDA